jgi:hypothetical protein
MFAAWDFGFAGTGVAMAIYLKHATDELQVKLPDQESPLS